MRANVVAMALSLGAILASVALVGPQEPFSVSPAEFVAKEVPPLGEPYLLEKKLVVRNGDNIERTFTLSVLAPPGENLREGYEAIPEPSWVILTPSVVEIGENSSATVDIYLNIPRQENLTSRKWEAWISVKRLPVAGEIAEIELIVRAKIETTSELPPPPSTLPSLPAMIALAGGVATALLLGWLARRRRARKPTLLRPLRASFARKNHQTATLR
jgi:hypothetical protein